MTKEVKGHDETPALIHDHPFEPKGAWYSLCKHCNLAMPAHAETTVDPLEEVRKSTRKIHIGYPGESEEESGNGHIAYVGDEDED